LVVEDLRLAWLGGTCANTCTNHHDDVSCTMSVPERYLRYPTRAAIDSLAKRFSLPNEPYMQDWEYEVADSMRLPEFLQALEREPFTDDERFTLSETVMECFEHLAAMGQEVEHSDGWKRFVALLRGRPELHARTLCYWSALDSELPDAFRLSSLVRKLWAELEPALLSAGSSSS
jgi:hypothetical protein